MGFSFDGNERVLQWWQWWDYRLLATKNVKMVTLVGFSSGGGNKDVTMVAAVGLSSGGNEDVMVAVVGFSYGGMLAEVEL